VRWNFCIIRCSVVRYMMTPSSFETIWQAANELEAEGVRPTLAAVRTKVGSGSFTTITNAMAEWRKRRQQDARTPLEPLPDEINRHVDEIGQRLVNISQQLRTLGSEIWAKARALADEQLIGLRQRLDTEKEELGAQMTEAVQLADRLTEEAEGLRRQLSDYQPLQAEHHALKAHVAEAERRHAEELALARDESARREAATNDARAAEKAALDRAVRAETRIEALDDQLAEVTGKLQRLESEQAGVRARMTEAEQLADRLEKEGEVLRRQLADHQALHAEHQALEAHVVEVERRHADELARAAERTARQDKATAEAGTAEKAALERAARAEGQVEALKNQLAGMTALLQPGAKGSAKGFHRGGGQNGY
jgi:chromosome segregation ATPase